MNNCRYSCWQKDIYRKPHMIRHDNVYSEIKNRHSKFVFFCRNYGVLSSADIYGRSRSNATRKWTEDGYVSDDQMQVTCENYASMVWTYEWMRSCIVIFVLCILICAYAWIVMVWIHVYILIFPPSSSGNSTFPLNSLGFCQTSPNLQSVYLSPSVFAGKLWSQYSIQSLDWKPKRIVRVC